MFTLCVVIVAVQFVIVDRRKLLLVYLNAVVKFFLHLWSVTTNTETHQRRRLECLCLITGHRSDKKLSYRDCATRKPAKDCWNLMYHWNDRQMSFKVIKSGTNRKLMYDFLLVEQYRWNILQRFEDRKVEVRRLGSHLQIPVQLSVKKCQRNSLVMITLINWNQRLVLFFIYLFSLYASFIAFLTHYMHHCPSCCLTLRPLLLFHVISFKILLTQWSDSFYNVQNLITWFHLFKLLAFQYFYIFFLSPWLIWQKMI